MSDIACWVLGDNPRSAFIVDIDKSMYVDTSKAKKPIFKGMAAGDEGECMPLLRIVFLHSECVRC